MNSSPPPPPPPPTSSAAKMLYEEGETHDGLTIWTPSNPYRPRSSHRRARICVAVTFALLMFGLGVSVGAFLHAMMFPDGSSPIVKLSSLLMSTDGNFNDDFDNSTLIHLNDVGTSVELEDTTVISGEEEEDEVEEVQESSEEEIHVESSTEKQKKKRRGGGKKEKKVDKKEEVVKEKEEEKKEDEEEVEEEEESEEEVDAPEEPVEQSGANFLKANKECTNITWYSSRLPLTAEPVEYELTLHPNLTTGHVDAEVRIKILVRSDTRLLILNAENLEMKSFEITRKGTKLKADFVSSWLGIFNILIFFQVKCEVMTQWAWKFGRRLHKGEHILLTIKYSLQVMKSDLQGLYYSTHLGTDGKKT
ncbi:hypothetical protein CAEBREN_28792 [Caenorhabditis brenneri]|uniref:Aminopeptidase N-like N-terminal domain-containing protein n=1 Tax=Caenorhabditis brenneri TaxID=135651 RepID=G0NCN0_CAEBE|nr:hypothetical protein CAEBREN_28792 [Caenorhabditis brenneri]